jgi:hypothetical protein
VSIRKCAVYLLWRNMCHVTCTAPAEFTIDLLYIAQVNYRHSSTNCKLCFNLKPFLWILETMSLYRQITDCIFNPRFDRCWQKLNCNVWLQLRLDKDYMHYAGFPTDTEIQRSIIHQYSSLFEFSCSWFFTVITLPVTAHAQSDTNRGNHTAMIVQYWLNHRPCKLT